MYIIFNYIKIKLLIYTLNQHLYIHIDKITILFELPLQWKNC